MNRSKFNGRFIMLAISCILSTTLLWGQANTTMHEGVIRLKVKPELVASSELSITKSSGIALTGVPSLDRLCKQYSASSIERVFPYNEKFEARHRKHGLHLWYEVKFESKENALKVAAAYASLNEVTHAEPLYTTKLITGVIKPMDNSAGTTSTLPFNDPYLPSQWHYNNTGDFDGLAGSDINLFNAWKVTAGTPNVVVSVHDQGVDYTHEDLAANMWKNMAEFNGQPKVDDDHNGFVDDIYGYNFAANTGKIEIMEHGTHVSGTIAAVNNNGKGVSGIAGGTGVGDGARIMSCQILGGSGSGNISRSYIYAADNGALISQNSWGYTTPGNYEQATLDAIDYFIAEAGNFAGSPMKGGVVIFAAGNDGVDELSYPGIYENVVAVSSLGPASTRAYYSNFGTWVDIASYGGDDSKHSQNQVLSTIPNNGYAYMQGTSMACPHVSGIAALILSKHGSPTFTNKDLLTHLLTGVRDVDSFNPDFAGRLGIGISDAALAVATDNKIAPDAINDLALSGISQDFATLQWTVPADQDDQKVLGFNIYYSTTPITQANFSSATALSLQNKKAQGETIEFEVADLQSTTQYYFAVTSLDRWKNESMISNVVNGTTNQGPTIALSKTEIDMALDINNATNVSDNFYILNKGEGVLKWTADFRHKNLYLPFNKTKLHYPVLQAQAATSQKSKLGRSSMAVKTLGVPIDGGTFSPIRKEYMDNEGASYNIGDEDLTLTNSEATRFTVTEDEGFNLTSVQAFFTHNNNTGPIIMEVYIGSSLKTANLTYAQEETSYMKDGYWHYIYLDENIYMEKGTDFWIVFHVPAKNKYPLAMQLELKDGSSANCFYSSNLGQTWQPLADAVDDNRWVFVVTAVSDQPTLGKYIAINPNTSQVLSGDSVQVDLSVDGTMMKNGSYTADVVISTNDKDNALVKLPVNLEITNHKPLLQVADVTDFGSVFVGTEKIIEVPVTNIGYGNFSQVTLNISDPQFELVDAAPWSIDARYEETIKFKFKPAAPGSANAVVSLSDVNGNKQDFYLNGVGSEPPVISLTPNQFTFTNLKLGNDFKATVNIQNPGKYPLKYAFAKFADQNTLNEFGTNVQKFGYTADVNLAGSGQPAYSYQDISSEPNVISEFSNNEYYSLDLGFDFPFYGKNYSKIFITRYGAVTFSDDGYFTGAPMYNYSSATGVISAVWDSKFSTSSGGIHYKRLPGKVIVEYHEIAYSIANIGKYYSTFQIILYDNGNIDLVYEDLSTWDPYYLTSWTAGISNPTRDDYYIVSDINKPIGITSQSIIRFYNPGVGALKAVSSVSGTVPVGGSKSVDMTFGTTDLHEGTFSELVTVLSNDPFNNPARAKVDFTITTGGVAQVSVDKDTLDFGTIFRTANENFVLAIQNTGTKDVIISTLSILGTEFTKDKVAPITLKARQTEYITITANTTKTGTFKRTLIIKTNKGINFTIPVSSVVVAEPIIGVDVTSIDKQLASGDSTKVQLTVSNTGKSNLEVVTQGTDWLYLHDDNSGSNKTYSWITSEDAGGPTYNWVDIHKTGTLLDSLSSIDDKLFWKGIKLPFSFTFYGKPYDSLYIGANGVMSFTRDTHAWLFAGDRIPSPNAPNNYIAPMWVYSGPDTYAYPEAGVYYQTFSDKIVVTYNKFRVTFGMGEAISFQAILYNNGNIKFQYDLGGFDETTHFGSIGVENEDGSDGVLIKDYGEGDGLLSDKMAIILLPASKQIIPALSSKKMTAIVDARYLYAGSYAANLTLQNNSPANPKLQIPATLIVTGEPSISGPDSLAFGEVMPYMEEDEYGIMGDKNYYQYFDLTNSGTDITQLNSFAFKIGSPEIVIETQVVDPWWGYTYWADVTQLFDPLVISPQSSLSLRARMVPVGPAHGVIDTLVVANSTTAGDFSIPISANVIMPPVMVLNPDHLTVQADTVGHQETKQFIIDNSTGASTLRYSMSLEYLRDKPASTSSVDKTNNKKATTSTSGRIASNPNAVLSEATNSSNAQGRSRTVETESLDTYNRILQYDTLSKAAHKLGFNGSSELWCATAFNAPSDGYTLSHVITWYVPDAWLNSDIIVEIRGGSDKVSTSKVLFTQTYNYTIPSQDDLGGFLEIPLDQPQSFYPNEKFFVVIKYPLAVLHPQGTAELNQSMSNTFMYSAGDGLWSDLIAIPGFENYAWMIKAAEKSAGTVGWASIDGSMEGIVEAGQQKSIDVAFNSRMALDADNYANLTVTSNDPYNKSAKVLLLLHLNQGPEFKDGEMKALSVDENDTLQYTVVAVDKEGDSFTYSLDSNYPHVKLEQSGTNAMFTLITDFTMAGDHEFIIHATDTFNNVSTLNLVVTVNNVNRKPVVVKAIPAKNYFKGEEAERINLEEFISDPDGDALNFVTTSSQTNVAQIFASTSQIMVSPETGGSSTIRIVATDPSGASDSLTFEVTVSPVAGVEKQHADFNVVAYPNPTAGKLLIHITGEVNRQYSLRVMNVLGVSVWEVSNVSSSQEDTELDLSKLARGVYFVEIADKSGKVIKRIAKD